MAVASLVSIADNYMKSWATTTNAGTETVVAIGEYNTQTNYVARTLIKFDFSSLGKVNVSSASLNMYLYLNYSSNTRVQRVYRCTKDWSETESTWTRYKVGNNWSTAGGDWDVTELGNLSIGDPSTGWTETTLSASGIEEMINGDVDNYGFLIKKDTELNDCNVFYSREHATYKPTLEVTYTPIGRIFQVVTIGM